MRTRVVIRRRYMLVLVMVMAVGSCMPSVNAANTRARQVPPPTELREGLRQLIRSARDRVFPALVHIHVVTVDYWGGKEHKGRSVGSGTVITPEGHVLTNCHVTLEGRKFKCVLSDKQEISAEKIGEDPLTDLAVLKLDLSELKEGTGTIPTAEFGDSAGVQVGDYVMAMGSPLALSRSVTLGIVSNVERILGMDSDDDPGELELQRGQRTGIFNRWIQHDAAINPGNSGGPLVNLYGRIVGVNTRGGGFGGDMGFAIPSNVARQVADTLIERGEVVRSWYGMAIKPIKRTGFERGVLVTSIVEGGPIDKAGIKPGDVIIEIDGQAETVRFPEQVPPLLRMLADRPVGSEVLFAVQRDKERIETTVVTEKLERDRGDEAAFRAWGLTARGITEKMARDRRLESTKGVLVTGTRNGGPAELAEPSLNWGDIVLSLDGEPVDDIEQFIGRYERIMDQEPLPEYVLVEFDRRGKNHLTLIKPKPEEQEDPPRELPKAWVGIATQPVLQRLAKQLGHPDQRGFRITRVYPRTKAAGSELAVGDVIVALNENRIAPRGMQDAGLLARRIRRLDIGDEATLTVLRDGDTVDVKVELERTRITPGEARRDRNEDFELTVREITFFDRDDRRWDPDIEGVIVEQVESAGWAGLAGIRSGDLIQRIGEHEITGLKSYRKAIEAITEAEPERIEVVVLRGARTSFQYIEPDWSPVAGDEDIGKDGTGNDEADKE